MGRWIYIVVTLKQHITRWHSALGDWSTSVSSGTAIMKQLETEDWPETDYWILKRAQNGAIERVIKVARKIERREEMER
jgi:hypothetical protein